jgi:hypothetical protein
MHVWEYKVNDQLHAPAALTPAKVLIVSMEQKDGWDQEPVWISAEKKNLSQPGNKPQFFRRIICILVSITTQLLRCILKGYLKY